MDMSVVFLLAMGVLASVLIAGFFQAVSVAVTHRAKGKRSVQK